MIVDQFDGKMVQRRLIIVFRPVRDGGTLEGIFRTYKIDSE